LPVARLRVLKRTFSEEEVAGKMAMDADTRESLR
jgi:hypothetical protein